jgi:hypothetical protein
MKTLQYTLIIAYMTNIEKAIIITQSLVYLVTTVNKLIIEPIAE